MSELNRLDEDFSGLGSVVDRGNSSTGSPNVLFDTVAMVIHTVSGTSIDSFAQRKRNRRLLLLVLCILVMVGGLIAFRSAAPELPTGVSRQEYNEAAADFRDMFGRNGDHSDVLMTLAGIAAKKKDSAAAIACYQQIPAEHIRYGPSARYEEALLFAHTDQVQRAEDSFNRFLKLRERGIRLPDRQVAHSRHWLSLILGVQLRHEDRRIVLHGLMEDHQADVHDVKQYYFESLLIWHSAFGSGRIRDFLKLDPSNRHLRNADARYLIGEGRLKEAHERLTKLHLEDPQDLRTQSYFLECAYEMNQWAAFSVIYADVPHFQESEPWLLTQMRAEWALHQNDWIEAEELFQYLLLIDPANAVCHMGLASAFAGQGKTAEREAVLQRSLLIAKVRASLAAVTNEDAKAARSIADLSRQLGMEDAAAIFEFFAARMQAKTK